VKVPNADCAVVQREKISEYLLSPIHRHGRGKAVFFRKFGFADTEWNVFAAALLRHVDQHDVQKIEDSPFGRRYTVEGGMGTPDGRTPIVRSIWFILNGQTIPRFVTAYPLGRKTR
jgi:hypothetical protein